MGTVTHLTARRSQRTPEDRFRPALTAAETAELTSGLAVRIAAVCGISLPKVAAALTFWGQSPALAGATVPS